MSERKVGEAQVEWTTHVVEYDPPDFTADEVLQNVRDRRSGISASRYFTAWADPEDIERAESRPSCQHEHGQLDCRIGIRKRAVDENAQRIINAKEKWRTPAR